MIEHLTSAPDAVTVELMPTGEALVTLRKQTGSIPTPEEGGSEQVICKTYQNISPYYDGLKTEIESKFELVFSALGVPYPAVIKNALETMKKKGDTIPQDEDEKPPDNVK